MNNFFYILNPADEIEELFKVLEIIGIGGLIIIGVIIVAIIIFITTIIIGISTSINEKNKQELSKNNKCPKCNSIYLVKINIVQIVEV